MPFNQTVGPPLLQSGDIENSGGGNLAIRPEKVTYGKIQQVSGGSKLLGSGSGYGAQDVREISLGSGLSMSGNVLSATVTGGVTAVSASNPLASSGGSTPNLTIQVATGGQDGYLSSVDWSTFNNKPSINRIMAHIAAY